MFQTCIQPFQRSHTFVAFKSHRLHVIDNTIYLVGRPRLIGGARGRRGCIALRRGMRMVYAPLTLTI